MIMLLTFDEKDEADDKHLASADFIKEDVIKLVSIAMSHSIHHNEKVEMFNIVSEVDAQLESMWIAYNTYRCAYDALAEEYRKLISNTKAEEEES